MMPKSTLFVLILGVCTMLLHQTRGTILDDIEHPIRPVFEESTQQSAPIRRKDSHVGSGMVIFEDGIRYNRVISPQKYGKIKIKWEIHPKIRFHTEKRTINGKKLLFKCSSFYDYRNELEFYEVSVVVFCYAYC
jgi:hypothetical protein